MSEESSFFSDFKQLIVDYVEARVQLVKIGAYEKIAKVTAVLFSSIVLAMLCFFMLFFLSISAGFYFGTLLNSDALGFIIVFGIYLLLLVFIIIYRKKLLEKYITDKVIEKLFEQDNNE